MGDSSNRTIAKNTIFLYCRMFFIMFVTLYTSRVVLDVLGVTDYSLYQTVGGVVGMLSFINAALSGGTSRFLTFELGTGNVEKLKNTFSTTLIIHLLLAILLLIICETVGLWFVNNKLVIPDDRHFAAIIVFHLSIITAIVNLFSIPYNASIISHEKMQIYAYVGVFECVAKLLIVYLLKIGGVDKLILYSILMLVIQLLISFFYFIYCNKYFSETSISFSFNKIIFKNILSYSSWNLFSQASIALKNQGVILLLNIFFSPAVVAARSISIQVNMAATQFISNFRTAVNPQIVKRYAAKDYEGSRNLLLSSTKYSYYLMLIICLPLCLLSEPILNIWLVDVPEYTVVFLQIILIQSLVQVFDTSFYAALYAKGQLKENAMLTPVLGIITFIVIYILFKCNYSPVVLSWAMLINYFILGVIIKPVLLIRIVDYSILEILNVFKSCLIVTSVALPLPLVFYFCITDTKKLLDCIILLCICILCVAISVWFLGISKMTRHKLINYIRNKIA